MAKIKVKQYQGCSNIDIANAILDLSNNFLNSCNSDEKLKDLVITLGITAWNISISENKDYDKTIDTKLPKGFSKEYNLIFKNFMVQFIEGKKEKYPNLLKGITSHKFSSKNGKDELIVHALPVKPL